MDFRIIGIVRDEETIARGSGIRERRRVVKAYGNGAWRKRKGIARIELPDGTVRTAELHWYEATGIGRREYKIKRYMDETP